MIEEYNREFNQESNSTYSEYYIDNTLLNRFIPIKFHDNAMSLLPNFEEDNRLSILDFTYNKALILLPTPVMNFFDINLNKNDFEYYFGDFIYELAGNSLISGFL